MPRIRKAGLASLLSVSSVQSVVHSLEFSAPRRRVNSSRVRHLAIALGILAKKRSDRRVCAAFVDARQEAVDGYKEFAFRDVSDFVFGRAYAWQSAFERRT